MPLEVQLAQGWLMRDVEKAVERKRVWSTSRYETFPDEGRKIEEAPVDAPRRQDDRQK